MEPIDLSVPLDVFSVLNCVTPRFLPNDDVISSAIVLGPNLAGFLKIDPIVLLPYVKPLWFSCNS